MQVEVALLVVILLIALLARFHALDRYPYGIEGDESLWTTKVAAWGLLGEERLDAAFRVRCAPVSFWLQTAAFRLFGLSFLTARYQVAALSVLAVLFFYLLVRMMMGVRTALVAALLLAVSMADLAMGRMALVESYIHFPLILSCWLLFVALRRGRLVWFLVTGLALVAGLFTFDTFALTPVVAFGYALRRAWVERTRWRMWLVRLVALALPLAAAAPRFFDCVKHREHELNKSVTSLFYGNPGWREVAARALGNLGEVLYNFYWQRWGDMAFNRPGPVVNAALVPLLALGLVWLGLRWRQGHNLFPLLWFGLQLFPAPIVLGAPYVRVMYPAFGALYVIVAAFIVALVEATPGWRRKLAAGGVVLFLAAVAVVNLYVYFEEMMDFPERVARRELADLAAAGAGPDRMLLVPYMPGLDDFVDLERSVVELAVGSQVGLHIAAQHHRMLSYGRLLSEVGAVEGAGEVVVLVDRKARSEGWLRQRALAALERCYSARRDEHGEQFGTYTITGEILGAPSCCSLGEFALEVAPEPGGYRFSWPAPTQTAFQLTCERLREGLLPVEAESLAGYKWFAVRGRDSPFLGLGYLADRWQAGRAEGTVPLSAGGDYQVWAHLYRRVLDEARLFLHLGEGEPLEMGSPERVRPGMWSWERIGELHLPAGEWDVALEKVYGGRQNTVLVDQVLLSADPAFDPRRQPVWEPVFDTGLVLSDVLSLSKGPLEGVVPSSQAEYWSEDSWEAGRYRCRVRLHADGLVDGFGEPGVWSDYTEFDVGKPDER